MGVALFDDNTNQVYYINFNQLGDSLKVYDSTQVDARFDIIEGAYVTKGTLQNILVQKNFLGTIPMKIGADSSLRAGGQKDGVQIGFEKQMHLADYPSYTWYRVLPPDTATVGDWSLYSVYSDFDENTTNRTFSNFIIAYNNLRKGNKPWMATGMEPEYELGYLGQPYTYYEWWYQFDWPSINIQYTNRPFQISQLVPYSGNPDSITASGVLSLDALSIGNEMSGGVANALYFGFVKTGVSFLTINDTFAIANNINNIDWLQQQGSGSFNIYLIKADSSDNVYIYTNNGAEYGNFIRMGAGLIGKTDSSVVLFGDYSRETNGIGIFGDALSANRGGFYYNGDNILFGLVRAGINNVADDWYDFPANDFNSRASLFLGGNLGLGTKTFGGSTVSFALAQTDVVPSTVAGQLGIYNESGILKVKDGSGNVTLLTGDVSFANITSLGKITSIYYNTSRVVTVNNSTPVDLTLGTAIMCYIRDISAGGTALVIYENGQTPTIVSQIGTVFTVSSPGASEIQLIGTGDQKITAQGGSGKNGAQVSVITMRAQE